MSTVQILGVVVAFLILLTLVVSLVVTRRKDRVIAEQESGAPRDDEASLFTGPPRDELERMPGSPREPERRQEPPAQASGGAAPSGAGAVSEVAGRTLAAGREEAAGGEAPGREVRQEPGGANVPARGGPGLGPEPGAPQSAEKSDGMIALSDLLVTTNGRYVNVQDPEVRGMLTDLVKYEIDLATQYRQLGQIDDAILQLTEAERICKALDMTSQASLVRQMMDDLRA